MLTLLKNYGSSTDQRRPSIALEQQTKKTASSLSVKGSSSSNKVDKEHWLSLQQALGDSQNFLDLLNSLKWEDGLPQEAINLIESKIATTANSDGRVTSLLRWDSAASETAGSSSFTSTGLITVAMAKYAAEAAAFMCGFAVSVVEYQRSLEPYRISKERASKLRKNVAGM